MKLKVNPEIQLRILHCSLCGDWVRSWRPDAELPDTSTWRGVGRVAKEHALESHPKALEEADSRVASGLDEPGEFWEDNFYLYTERRLTITD